MPLDEDCRAGEPTDDGADPEYEALVADSVGLALLVVLDTLTPAERVAFVLHDLFGVPFDEIAPILGRNPAATRQLASRARRRVARGRRAEATALRQAALVDAFLAAARTGDFERCSPCWIPTSSSAPTRPPRVSARPRRCEGAARSPSSSRYARGGTPALLDGAAAVVWMPGGAAASRLPLHDERRRRSRRSS